MSFDFIKIFSNYFNLNDNNSQILDPFSTIIRLCLLKYKPIGTKISISNNKIEYQNPTALQGTIRWAHGDDRTQLHNFQNPLIISRYWFNYEKDRRITFLFNLAIVGLENMKKSYKDDGNPICHALNYYINILKHEQVIDDLDENIDKQNVIYKTLKNNWKDNEIDIVFYIFQLVEENIKNEQIYDYYLYSVEKIIDGKDKQIFKLIKDTVHGKI